MARTLAFEPLSLEEAQALTDRTRIAGEHFVDGIEECWNRHADEAMGFGSWEEYVKTHFPAIPRFDDGNKRTTLAKKLHEVGMTNREAAVTLGVGKTTIQRDIHGRPGNPKRGGPIPEATFVKAEKLARDGLNYQEMGSALGVDEASLRRDLKVRAARAEADPFVHGSDRHPENTIACAIAPATEVIRSVEHDVQYLLNKNYYTLSPRDRKRLTALLTSALTELENY